MFDKVPEPISKQTEFLLKSISSRLAGRDNCRNVTYRVIIDHNGVRMSPLVYVFPNRYKRRESDKKEIIQFIHENKMNGSMLSGFVFGTYEYRPSYDNKRRKWVKL